MQTPKSGLISSQEPIIKSLVRACSTLSVLEMDEDVPTGCALYTMEDTKIYLLVKGMVDISAEIEKLESKKEKLSLLRDGVVKRMSGEGYAVHVKDDVKEADAAKVVGYDAEIRAICDSIETFVQLGKE